MRANPLNWTLVIMLAVLAVQSAVGQSQSARKRFADIKTQAEAGDAESQFKLGVCYADGDGVAKDPGTAVKWYRLAAESGHAEAQYRLGTCLSAGVGVAKDYSEAVKWLRKAAEQDLADAQFFLGVRYSEGEGTPKNLVEAHKWLNLAASHDHGVAKAWLAHVEELMTKEQLAEVNKTPRESKPPRPTSPRPQSKLDFSDLSPSATGTGFFITEDGFLVTNEHVVEKAIQLRLVGGAGLIAARVVKVDAANDLALLKAEGKFSALPVVASRGAKLGATVATVGFPNIGMQGFAPKLAKGEIASLSGPQDDARYFQISAPVQPGNSGGALVDERGNVVGVVSAKLSASAALKATGALPENVNYAIKSSYLLSFLESVPEVAAKLKEPNTQERKFEDVVKDAEQAAVLVLVY
jgi:TPR repeat protein